MLVGHYTDDISLRITWRNCMSNAFMPKNYPVFKLLASNCIFVCLCLLLKKELSIPDLIFYYCT